ncbi:TPA: translational GTPase TypA [Candidatus Sumerlaeota bacterium]|nr:translational GTPase TypA [Candidatus Sumerlaeota bacterium]
MPVVAHDKIRNLAIIAHIDHGKTTLIDSIFRSAHVFRDNQQMGERVMDSGDLERERGITIRSKHCTVQWKDYLINIVDTPGHADFSGEVERVLSMVDGCLLLVDANEGPMPQTRYVLMRALKMGLHPIVLVNKVDRPHARPSEALHKTFDLFFELGATDEQADFTTLYGSGLDGWFVRDLEKDTQRENMDALFETIISTSPAPVVEEGKPFRMQVCTLAWNDYIGRIGCGRVMSGSLKVGDSFLRTTTTWNDIGNPDAGWTVGPSKVEKSAHQWVTRGLQRTEEPEIGAGDIVWIAGPEEINIGDTFSSVDFENPALPPLEIEEPTVSMLFLVNNGPFSGNDGKSVTLRQLKERIERELRVNVALRMEDVGRADGVKVSGRGELHLAVLIEEMRREGLELCVSRPEVITHEVNGKTMEPMESLIVDVPEESQGVVIEKLAKRKAEMTHMESTGTGIIRIEFTIPTRGLIGYRSEFLTDTRGLGIMASRFKNYGPWCGEIPARNRGSVVSMESGAATGYQIESLQQRTQLFIEPMDQIYAGQIVGENSRPEDLPCNPTKKKALTNHRSATKDQTVMLNAARKISLDQALEWIADDELVEVTPNRVRIRKAILDAEQRKKADNARKSL